MGYVTISIYGEPDDLAKFVRELDKLENPLPPIQAHNGHTCQCDCKDKKDKPSKPEFPVIEYKDDERNSSSMYDMP